MDSAIGVFIDPPTGTPPAAASVSLLYVPGMLDPSSRARSVQGGIGVRCFVLVNIGLNTQPLQ